LFFILPVCGELLYRAGRMFFIVAEQRRPEAAVCERASYTLTAIARPRSLHVCSASIVSHYPLMPCRAQQMMSLCSCPLSRPANGVVPKLHLSLSQTATHHSRPLSSSLCRGTPIASRFAPRRRLLSNAARSSG
jgi:hypothetical protein